MRHAAPEPTQVDIGAELARGEIARLRFAHPVLEARYAADALAQARPYNRLMVPVLIAIFDLFFLTEWIAEPEVLVVSAWLRFGLLTPATALFVVLDRRGRLGRWNRAAVTALAAAPTLFACLELPLAVSADALPNIQAIPLIQLAALTWRMDVRQAAIANAVSCLVFATFIRFCPAVPAAFIPAMTLTDVAIGIAVLVFALRVDQRERLVFLLVAQAEASRAVLAEQNRGLTRENQTDALTGCANRRCFDETLAAAWADGLREGKPVGLVMIDIDHFKRFNDHYGHQGGDECLARVAAQASREVRVGDTLARYGGEEFAVVIVDAALAEVRAIAERIRAAVAAMALPHQGVGPHAVVSVSLGAAAVIPRGAGGARLLVEAADRCLYEAKRAGRDRVVASDGGVPLAAGHAAAPTALGA